MSPDRIRTILAEEPFRPFTIVTGDGSEIDVLTPDYAWLYPGGRTLLIFVPLKAKANKESDFEEHRIDVFLITKVITPIPKRKPRRRAG